MIRRDMKSVTLQVRKEVETKSGAQKYDWVDEKHIEVAIYKTNSFINSNSVRYNESTHTGLTRYKDIKEGINRIVEGETIYNITAADNKSRLTNLLLKVVDTNV